MNVTRTDVRLFIYCYIACVGACIGSFLNVVIYRLPRGISVVRPRSRCPWCGLRLAWYHNIPIGSYLGLRGRCAACHAPIARVYWMIEGGTALVFAGLFHTFGWTSAFLRCALLVSLLIAAAEIDRRHGVIPNRLVTAGAVMGLVSALITDASTLATLVPAAIASAVVLLLIRAGSHLAWGRPGLGMGDVKLAAVMGLFLGWENLWVCYLAVMLAGMMGLLGLLLGRLNRTTPVPFAPFMALGACLHLFVLPPELIGLT